MLNEEESESKSKVAGRMKYEGRSEGKQGAIFLSQFVKFEIKKHIHQIEVVYGRFSC